MRSLIAVIQDGREYFDEVEDSDDAIDKFATEAVHSFGVSHLPQVMVKIYRADRVFVKYVAVRQQLDASRKKASKK